MYCTNPDNVNCFGTIFPNLNLVFASICATRPVHIQSDQYRSCSTVNQQHAVDGEQPKTTLWLWVCEMTWYLDTRRVCGRMKAKQRWFKVTRELCDEWFHHIWRYVHDGHWTGEFATVIWRLHCFTVSFLGDVRRESGPRELASVNLGTLQWARGQFTRTIIPDWFAKRRDIKFWYMC